MTVRIPLLTQKNIKAWPKSETGGRVRYVDLGETLTSTYATDAHFACYSLPSVERRLCVELVRDPANADKVAAGVPMVLASFDVDCELSHKSSGATTPIPAPDEWWLDELPRFIVLLELHPGLFVYRTKGGYRIIAVLVVPFIVRNADDDEKWTSNYIRWVAYLRRVAGIYADPGCADWTRLFRAPHATRDGSAKPEQRETIGDPHAVGPWACEPTAEDISLALTLKKQKAPKKSKAPKGAVKSACAGEGVLFQAFKARGAIGQELEPGKWAVECPNVAQHSKGDALDSSTVLWAPRLDDGETLGWLHCSHAHCQTLTAADIVDRFTSEEMSAARVAAGLPADGVAPASTGAELLYDSGGNPKKIVANVLAVLDAAPECSGLLAYDEFREAIVVLRDPPCRHSERPPKRENDEWSEEDSTRFAAWLASKFELDVSSGQAEEAIRAVARKHTVHPVRDWQDSLVWDGTPRLERLFSTYFGAAYTPYVGGIAVCWMVSGVARVHQPGCQADYLVVLEGEQGTGKTTGLEALAGKEWFSDTALDINSKDGPQCLRGKWLHLFDELEGISGRAAVSRVKNFLSRRDDNYRPSFGRRNRTFNRQNIFAATTNEKEYLQDPTGNRRIWPLRCGLVDVEGIRRDRDKLWAEAVHLYQSGTKWWPSIELAELCKPQQEERLQNDPWLSMIANWLDDPEQEVEDIMETGRVFRRSAPFDLSKGVLVADVLVHCLRKRRGDCTRADEMRAGAVLRTLGYERGPQRREAGERVRRFVKPVTTSDQKNGGDEVVTPGGDAMKQPNPSVNMYMSPLSPPNTHNGRTHEACFAASIVPNRDLTESRGDGSDGGDSTDLNVVFPFGHNVVQGAA